MARAFRGTYTALVTPFRGDGAIDYAAVERLLEAQLRAGIEGVVVLGTTGESPTVGIEEAGELWRRVSDYSGDRLRVIAGIGSNDTARTLHQAEAAQAAGVAGLLVTCPYYSRPSQAGLRAHFEAVAAAVALPQLLYNIPGRTGVNLEPQTVAELSRVSNIVGLKEANPDMSHVLSVLAAVPQEFAVLSGNDELTLPMIALGGAGTVSVLSNLLPERFKALVDAALSGRVAEARDCHRELLPLMRGCALETNPVPIKTALAWSGVLEPVFRPPLCPMQPEAAQRWRERLIAGGVLGAEAWPATAAVGA